VQALGRRTRGARIPDEFARGGDLLRDGAKIESDAGAASGSVARSDGDLDRQEFAAAVAGQLWYHIIELAPGVVTPGRYDLLPLYPLPDWHGSTRTRA